MLENPRSGIIVLFHLKTQYPRYSSPKITFLQVPQNTTKKLSLKQNIQNPIRTVI